MKAKVTKPRSGTLFTTGCFVLGLWFLLISPAHAEWKEKVLYSFQGGTDGTVPAGGVVFDKAGNLYGTTLDGGSPSCPSPQQCGTVYQLAPPAHQGGAWTETVLYVFKGHNQNDGASPEGGLVIDQAGNLYGTTGYGGKGPCILLGTAVGCGTVFELSPPAKQGEPWTETVLYSFQGGNDGYVPSGDLVFDKSGNLYGATLFGGGKGTTCDPFYQYCGTVFKLNPPKAKGGKWTEKVLYSFSGGNTGKQNGDGANPNGRLILDSKGAIYGTTFYGGNETGECNGGVGGIGCGIVFELLPPTREGGAWTQRILHRFRAQPDGDNPAAGLTLRGADLYGTTQRGGTSGGPGGGTIFRIVPPSKKFGFWKETVLYSFNGDEHGTFPMARLILDSAGNLYSTTNGGTTQCHYGNVFRISGKAQKWSLSVLYEFVGGSGSEYPAASLAFDKNGNAYSTTQAGGTGTCTFGCGTVYQVSP